MRKIFTIFLMTAMIGASVSGCGSAKPGFTPKPTFAVVRYENEDVDAVATASQEGGAIDALETAIPTEDINEEVMYYTEDEVVMMAKLLWHECRGVPSDTEKACVAWAVCNRVDDEEFDGDTVTEVMTIPNQFAYYYDTPVLDELYDLALDVLTRWNAERNGEVSVGRVLPKDYTYYTGDGVHNYFRNAYNGHYSIWDYSLPSPYES